MIYGLVRGLLFREVIYWIVIMYIQGGLPDWMTESVILIIIRILDIIVRGSLWNSVYELINYFANNAFGTSLNRLYEECCFFRNFFILFDY